MTTNEKKLEQAKRAKESIELTLNNNGIKVLEKRIIEMSEEDKQSFSIGDYHIVLAIEVAKSSFYIMVFEGDEDGNIYSLEDGTFEYVPLVNTGLTNLGIFPQEFMGTVLENYEEFLSGVVYKELPKDKQKLFM